MGITFIGLLNSTDGQCPWLKQPIPCDFDLYSSNQSLTDSQKLLPNTDITGSRILIMFVATGFAALGLSCLLLGTDACLLLKVWSHDTAKHKFHRHTLHTIDTTLHTLSDFQITSGLALLVVALFHASCISAYHYNVICYLMVMSVTTHVLVLVNVPKFYAKNFWVGSLRVVGIIATFALTWALFKARGNIESFPVQASSLSIMPAACFVGNQTSALNTSSLLSVSSNASSPSNISSPSNSSEPGVLTNVTNFLFATGTGEGADEFNNTFKPVIGFVFFALVFLCFDTFRATELLMHKVLERPPHWRMWFTLILRSIITVFVAIVAILATRNFYTMKNGFEKDEWYVKTEEDTASMSQIVILMMSITPLFAAFKTFGEDIAGPRSAKETGKVLTALQTGIPEAQDAADEVQQDAPVLEKDSAWVQQRYSSQQGLV